MATLLTDVGAGYIAALMVSHNPVGFTFIGAGIGAGVASKTDTALFGESTDVPRSAAATRTQPASNIVRWTGAIQVRAAVSLTNAGVLTTPGMGTGTLVMHGDHAAIDLESGDIIEYAIDLELTGGIVYDRYVMVGGMVVPAQEQ